MKLVQKGKEKEKKEQKVVNGSLWQKKAQLIDKVNYHYHYYYHYLI